MHLNAMMNNELIDELEMRIVKLKLIIQIFKVEDLNISIFVQWGNSVFHDDLSVWVKIDDVGLPLEYVEGHSNIKIETSTTLTSSLTIISDEFKNESEFKRRMMESAIQEEENDAFWNPKFLA